MGISSPAPGFAIRRWLHSRRANYTPNSYRSYSAFSRLMGGSKLTRRLRVLGFSSLQGRGTCSALTELFREILLRISCFSIPAHPPFWSTLLHVRPMLPLQTSQAAHCSC